MSVTTLPVARPASPAPASLVPQNMDQAVRLADMMARAKLVPQHLQQSPGDCLLVVEQSMRWGMSPFAVAQCTSSIKGKLMFEGKLVAAAVESSGAIEGFLDYRFEGAGNDRRIIVSGRRRGEADPRTVEVALKDARTENRMWQIQPDQQLVYHGARVWARRWTPAVLLGVYSPEEFTPAVVPEAFTGQTIEAEPVAPEPKPEPTQPKQRTRKDFLDDLERELAAAVDAEAVDAITSRADVQKALDVFANGHLIRLNAMVKVARDRTAPAFDGELAESAP